mmetsp:Transcript_8722/g.15785  ORF Transcript_8722/g.15785 Transcript_8722/m.15785 type:complete len:110 (+) Transcript_8722:12-341(+)
MHLEGNNALLQTIHLKDIYLFFDLQLFQPKSSYWINIYIFFSHTSTRFSHSHTQCCTMTASTLSPSLSSTVAFFPLHPSTHPPSPVASFNFPIKKSTPPFTPPKNFSTK